MGELAESLSCSSPRLSSSPEACDRAGSLTHSRMGDVNPGCVEKMRLAPRSTNSGNDSNSDLKCSHSRRNHGVRMRRSADRSIKFHIRFGMRRSKGNVPEASAVSVNLATRNVLVRSDGRRLRCQHHVSDISGMATCESCTQAPLRTAVSTAAHFVLLNRSVN